MAKPQFLDEKVSSQHGELISANDYHRGVTWGPLLSSHQFLPFYQSPSAFRFPLPRQPISDALRLGQLFAHVIECRCTDRDPYDGIFEMPIWGFKSAVDKARWVSMQRNLGIETPRTSKKEILDIVAWSVEQRELIACTNDELEYANDQAMSVLLNPHASDLLSGAIHERSYRANGCKARPDVLSSNLLVDFKTTAKPLNRWKNQAYELGYPEQLAWYDNVLQACGRIVDQWLWIVISSKPYRLDSEGRKVHEVTVFHAEDSLRQRALDKLDDALLRYYHCCQSNDWPDADREIETLYNRDYY